MAGLGLALVGGALKGFGEGQLANIKSTREEKLRQLELDRAERMETGRQTFAAREGELGRASQERQSAAQIAATERNTQAQLGTQTALTKLEIGSREKLSGDQLAQRRDEIAAQIESGEKIAGMQADTQKDIAKAQIDAQKDLNVTFQTQADGSSVMMRAGKPVAMPIDPATGKPMSPAITDNDTNEAKNVKYLMTLGVSAEKAMDRVYNAKNANRDLAQAGIFKSIVDGMSTMKNLGESDFDFAQSKAKSITDSIYGPDGTATPPAPGEPTSAADPGTTAPAPDAAAAAIKFPDGTTTEEAVAWAKQQLEKGKSRAAIKDALKANKVDPTLVPGL